MKFKFFLLCYMQLGLHRPWQLYMWEGGCMGVLNVMGSAKYQGSVYFSRVWMSNKDANKTLNKWAYHWKEVEVNWDILYIYCELVVSSLLLFVILADKMTNKWFILHFSYKKTKTERLRILFLRYKSLKKPNMPTNKVRVCFFFSSLVLYSGFWYVIWS